MTTDRFSPGWPSARSPVVATIGSPIAHSMSPLLHNAAFDALGLDWVSVAFEVSSGQAAAALQGMRAMGIAGMSVTMPHKEDVARLVDELSPLAQSLGAVNCVTLRQDRLYGDSTDGPGFLDALSRSRGFDPSGRRCLVLGAGGAARAVVHALADAGASEVVVLNRDPRRAEVAAALAGRSGRVGTAADAADAELVVQATPVGMDGADQSHPLLDPASLHAGQVVVDLVYRPPTTQLMAQAREAGADVVNGLGMLVHQAARALESWTGQTAPLDAMWEAAQAACSPTR